MEITSSANLREVLQKYPLVVLQFWAPWSQPAVQMNTICAELAGTYPAIQFVQIEAEKHADISGEYKVTAVPYFTFIKDKAVIDTLEGANPPELAKKIKTLSEFKEKSVSPATTAQSDLTERLTRLVNHAPVMLFIKGTPSEPQCGFSRQIVAILKEDKIDYSAFNILADNTVREGLKKFSNWPTYPQLYVKGKLIGGLDIVREMHEEGNLKEIIPDEAKGNMEGLNQRLSALINKAPVMLFMKGVPADPQCGFSAKIVDILKESAIKFDSFDILTDNTVREGLKKYSNWPTYPQLYVKGKLIGGLDIVREMHEEGSLKEVIPEEAKAS